MLDERQAIRITSPDCEFPPRDVGTVFSQQYGCAIRGNLACSVDYFRPNVYNVMISKLDSGTVILSELVDFDTLVTLIRPFGFTVE